VVELLKHFSNSIIHLSIKNIYLSWLVVMVSSLNAVIKMLARSGSSVVLMHTTWSQHIAQVTVGDVYCITDCFLGVMGVSHLHCVVSQV